MDNSSGGGGGGGGGAWQQGQQGQPGGNMTGQQARQAQTQQVQGQQGGQQGVGGSSLAFQQLQRSIATANVPHVPLPPGVATIHPFQQQQQPQGTSVNGNYTMQQLQQMCTSMGMQQPQQQGGLGMGMQQQPTGGMMPQQQRQQHGGAPGVQMSSGMGMQQQAMGGRMTQHQLPVMQTSSGMGIQQQQPMTGILRQHVGGMDVQTSSSAPMQRQQHMASMPMQHYQQPQQCGGMGSQTTSSMMPEQQKMGGGLVPQQQQQQQHIGGMVGQTSSGMAMQQLQPMSSMPQQHQQQPQRVWGMGGQVSSGIAMQQQPSSSVPQQSGGMGGQSHFGMGTVQQRASSMPQQQQQQQQALHVGGVGGQMSPSMPMQHQQQPASSMPQLIGSISNHTGMAMQQQQRVGGGMGGQSSSSMAMQQLQLSTSMPQQQPPQQALAMGGQTGSGLAMGQQQQQQPQHQQATSSVPQQQHQYNSAVSGAAAIPGANVQQQQQQQLMGGTNGATVGGVGARHQMPPASAVGVASPTAATTQQQTGEGVRQGVVQQEAQAGAGLPATPQQGKVGGEGVGEDALKSGMTAAVANAPVTPVAGAPASLPATTGAPSSADLAAAGAAAAAALPAELTSALQQIAQMQSYIQQQIAAPANLSSMTAAETEAWKARQREAAAMSVILQQRQSAAMAAIIQHNRKVASGAGTPAAPSTSGAPTPAPAPRPKPAANRSPATPPTPSMGFISAQLTCLRNQILTFKRIKRGDKMTTAEVTKAITPPPLKKSNRGRKPKAIMPGPTPIREAVQAAAATTPKPAGPTPAEIKAAQKAAAQKLAAERAAQRAAAKAAAAKEAAAQKAAAVARAAAQKAAALAAAKAKADALAAAKAREAALAPKKPTVKDHRTLARFLNPLATVANSSTEHVTASPYGSLRAVAPDAKPVANLQIDVQDLMAGEFERQLALRKQTRLEELEAALAKPPANGPLRPPVPGAMPERGRLRLQLLLCRLEERQAALREVVESEQAEVLDMSDRMYRKYVRTLDRKNQDIAKVAEKARQEKAAEKARALRSWRSDLGDRASAARELRNARNRGILRAHDRMLRAATKSKEDARTRRMEALKANDFEAYQEMLKTQQGSGPGGEAGGDNWQEISKFLNDTERYLESLGSKLASVKAGQEATEAAEQAAAEARAVGLGEDEVKIIAAAAAEEANANSRIMKQANNIHGGDAQSRYYSLAHSIEEKVLSKPSMLIPPNNGSLREYQMKGLAWMVSLYNNHLNGILADEMGLGKTVQVMALIAYLMESKGNYGPHLIIVPNAVLVNWKSELQTWLPSVRCVYYVGHREERARKFASEVLPMQFNVLVTTYEFIMRDRSKLSKVEWKYIIIDEAQRMKDRSSKLAKDLDRYTAARRLLLTGTPLQNELAELWSLLNLLLPDVFDDHKGFTEWFSDSIAGAEEGGGGSDAELLEKEKRVVVIHRLHQILEPFMLRRQVADVETKLPPKIVHTIKCAMTPFQQCVYNWVKATGTKRIDPLAKQGKIHREYAPLNNRVMELRKVCNHPLLSYPPLDMYPVDLVRKCGKMMVLDRILVKLFHTPHRVLLFSTMTKLLDVMENYLRWRQVDGPNGKQLMKFARIDGSTALEDREEAIQEFRRPDSETFIFLLSIRAAGRGLNLQTSDTVIIFDPDHNPKNEEQAIARSHRIGQTKEVQVMFMESVPEAPPEAIAAAQPPPSERGSAPPDKLYADSIESLIRNTIQKMKIDMANEVIDAGRFDGQTTNEERKQTLESLLQDEDRNAKAKNEVPDFAALNRMLGRNQEEVELFDRLDRELQWPEPEGEDAIPDWLGYSPEELNRVAMENRPSACGLDARADRAAKAAAEAEAAMGYGRGRRHQEASVKAAEPETYSWEKEVGAAGLDEEEETGDKVLQQEDSRGHTWDTPNQPTSGRVEEGSEVAGPAMKRVRSEAAVDGPSEPCAEAAPPVMAAPTEEGEERQKGHHHRHKHHKHKKEKKEKDDKKEKRHKRKHQQDVAEEEAGGAKRQNTADGKPPAAPAKLKIKLVSKKPK